MEVSKKEAYICLCVRVEMGGGGGGGVTVEVCGCVGVCAGRWAYLRVWVGRRASACVHVVCVLFLV